MTQQHWTLKRATSVIVIKVGVRKGGGKSYLGGAPGLPTGWRGSFLADQAAHVSLSDQFKLNGAWRQDCYASGTLSAWLRWILKHQSIIS
jgi:hypothetical protein